MRRVLAMNPGIPGVGGARRRRALPLALVSVLAAAVVCVLPCWAAAQPEQVNEFVPIDELPEEDRLPAAPFLISAYAIVWILAFGYFWLLSRRQADVERDLAELARRRPVPDDDDPLEAA